MKNLINNATMKLGKLVCESLHKENFTEILDNERRRLFKEPLLKNIKIEEINCERSWMRCYGWRIKINKKASGKAIVAVSYKNNIPAYKHCNWVGMFAVDFHEGEGWLCHVHGPYDDLKQEPGYVGQRAGIEFPGEECTVILVSDDSISEVFEVKRDEKIIKIADFWGNSVRVADEKQVRLRKKWQKEAEEWQKEAERANRHKLDLIKKSECKKF